MIENYDNELSKKQIQSFKKLNPKNVSDAKLCKSRITAGLIWGECYWLTLLHFYIGKNSLLAHHLGEARTAFFPDNGRLHKGFFL